MREDCAPGLVRLLAHAKRVAFVLMELALSGNLLRGVASIVLRSTMGEIGGLLGCWARWKGRAGVGRGRKKCRAGSGGRGERARAVDQVARRRARSREDVEEGAGEGCRSRYHCFVGRKKGLHFLYTCMLYRFILCC